VSEASARIGPVFDCVGRHKLIGESQSQTIAQVNLVPVRIALGSGNEILIHGGDQRSNGHSANVQMELVINGSSLAIA
jgi:hypothetical protein